MTKSIFVLIEGAAIVLTLVACAAKPAPPPVIAPLDTAAIEAARQQMLVRHQAIIDSILAAEKPPRPLTAAEEKIIGDAVGDTLKDPFTAHYTFRPDKGLLFVCGQVNSKNAYGAYVGFERFYVDVTRNASGHIIEAHGAALPNHETSYAHNDVCDIAGY